MKWGIYIIEEKGLARSQSAYNVSNSRMMHIRKN